MNKKYFLYYIVLLLLLILPWCDSIVPKLPVVNVGSDYTLTSYNRMSYICWDSRIYVALLDGHRGGITAYNTSEGKPYTCKAFCAENPHICGVIEKNADEKELYNKLKEKYEKK